MSIIQQRFSRSPLGPVSIAFCGRGRYHLRAPHLRKYQAHRGSRKGDRPLAIERRPGKRNASANKGDKQYLYVQKASKQGFTVIDVTKPGSA